MGAVTALAGLAFGAALGLLGTFFATRDARFDRLAEVCFVAFGILAVPAIVTVSGMFPDAPVVIAAVSVVGLAGVVVLAAAELGSLLGLLDFRRIAPFVTIAFLAFLAWIAAVSVLTLVQGGLPAGLGWLGVASIVLGLLAFASIAATPGVLRGEREPSTARMAPFLASMVGVVAWMVWLGISL